MSLNSLYAICDPSADVLELMLRQPCDVIVQYFSPHEDLC
jgi:hypothetical protein